MRMKELVERVDAHIQYPGERIIERYVPAVDRIIDYVITGIFVMEDLFDGESGHGEEKKENLMTVLLWIWDITPMPGPVRVFLRPLLEVTLPWLIDEVVEFLNGLLSGPEKDLRALLPLDEFKTDTNAVAWIQTALATAE